MGKDITSLPEVWIVTGLNYDFGGQRVLAVCPTEQDAQNAIHYYKKKYNKVEYECFSQETYEPVPIYYEGVFVAEVRPYKDGTYILGQVRIIQSENSLDKDVGPKELENISFTLTSKINDVGYESYELRGNYISAMKVPIKTDINVGKAAKEWLINKINEKDVIKLVIPDFDE